MNQFGLKKISYLIFILIFGFLGTRCATPQKELRTYPLTEINLEKVFHENQGLKVLEENATMIHDYYRGCAETRLHVAQTVEIHQHRVASRLR